MNFNYYIDGNSILHRVNPVVKYALMLAFFFSLPFTNFYENLVYALLIQLLIVVNKLPYRYIQRKMLFIIPMTIFFAVGMLFYPLLPISFALKLGLRLYIMLSMILVINMTTPINELLGIFNGIIRRFTSKETTENMTMIFLLVINFIPLIISEMGKVNQSLKSRRITIKNKSMKKNMFYLSSFVSAMVRRLDVLIDEFDLVFYARNITVDNLVHIQKANKYNLIDGIFIIISVGLVLVTNFKI